ncbi:glycoside hydrolase family 57 protein [Candidatus Woesearchaeota archaeon]|nr:glycoside hydrolase family 57 protein [Candidatus Woesearchaeota archaeon]MBW3016303.1 glycoside hydrolase family 57 protein [Candidatus Woesearchaeota archaeon]
MTNICLYFQVHQPFRINKYTLFDIGRHANYFDEKKNKEIMQKIARKCYLPTNQIISQLIKKHDDFKAAYSITGTAIEQFEKYAPNVLRSFKELAETGRVEFLTETSHHSLSFLQDKEEFRHQIKLHQKLIKQHFNQKPKIFRNTELIYNNELAKTAERLGFKAVLAEGWEGILGWRSPNHIYKAAGTNIKLLLKNYRLSDDIAFRFSNKQWNQHPLTADKYAGWIAPILGDTVNLFMDYETFGEHQWEDTGIFNFLKHLPKELKKHNISFHQPSELLKIKPKEEIDAPNTISWADMERDTSAWLGNKIQKAAHAQLYKLKNEVFSTGDRELIEKWRKLTTSDHFYYMCTKYFNDGDVHKYFNPYETPYECFITYMNVLQDLAQRAKARPGIFQSIKNLIREVKS